MRSPAHMTTIQIELTSACVLKCSNCTRFCGTHRVPFFMEDDLFRKSIDSLAEFATTPEGIVGFMGGEPLLHPKFAEFCEYALTKIPRERLGLWSTFPPGEKYRKYREIICKTFGVILLNDHSRDDILHAPVLMASEEYFRKPCPVCEGSGENTGMLPGAKCVQCGGTGTVTDDRELFLATEHCWVQESWSASINPKGAWFCEVAAALADLFDGPQGWDVEPGWWKRTPMDFKEQRDWACRRCGAAMPIKRIRSSQDPRDDVSEGNLERLKAVRSKKVARGEYEVRKFEFDPELTRNHGYPTQTYKDEMYRRGIAERYGITLVMQPTGFWEPRLSEDVPYQPPKQTLYQILKAEYDGGEAARG